MVGATLEITVASGLKCLIESRVGNIDASELAILQHLSRPHHGLRYERKGDNLKGRRQSLASPSRPDAPLKVTDELFD